MNTIDRLVVLIPVSSVANFDNLMNLMKEISTVVSNKPVRNLVFLLAANNKDSDGTSTRLEIAKRISSEFSVSELGQKLIVEVRYIGIDHIGGKLTDVGAGRYVYGWFKASEIALEASGASFVIESDSEDHPVFSFERVLDELLNGKSASMSTRFFRQGAAHRGPKTRYLTSLGATLLANIFGKPGLFVPDLASGLEGYDARLINRIFQAKPWENWITMGKDGTTVLINTELRLYVLWTFGFDGADLDKTVAFPPIVFSEKGALQAFPAKVGFKAIRGLFRIFNARSSFLAELRKVPRE